ncbi:MAG: thiosulfohydrolase SoxB [Limnobacter sp.]|nr:thiosulfohydrolase SoxB [Limnobacter sp.]
MQMNRREFMGVLAAGSAAGMALDSPFAEAAAGTPSKLYDIKPFGNASLLHFTDCHAQLLPIYFREPNVNLGVGSSLGKAPHLVGEYLLKAFNIPKNGIEAHAFTYLNFENAARTYGKVGGFAHLATLIKLMKAQRPGAVLMDGGDTWQGSGTSLWTNAQDMVDASLKLGVEVMTLHWECTYGQDRVLEIAKKDFAGKIDILAQNIKTVEFEDAVFPSHVIKVINGAKVAIIGQAFPYTPIANPRYMVSDWSFGIRDDHLQEVVNKAKSEGSEVCVLLSHNGMDVDLKLASRVEGLDFICGGHTHDGIPKAIPVKNKSGITHVTNAGSNSKFLGVLDMDIRNGKLIDFKYRLLPVFSNLLPADKDMSDHIEKMRQPFVAKLAEPLAVTEGALYRRGNFNGTWDQLIVEALMEVKGAEIAFSPGFRWGTSLLPGQTITREHLMDQTAITYGNTTLSNMTGETIKTILEDVADNLFNPDPYYQQGGDMVRVGGLTYTCTPGEKMGARISNMRLDGKVIEAGKSYKVAGWAPVAEEARQNGEPMIWDVVETYLKSKKTITTQKPNLPKLVGMEKNPGIQ